MPIKALTTNHRVRDLGLLTLLAAAIFAANANTLTFPFLFDGLPLEQGLRTLSLGDPVNWIRIRPRLFGYLTFDLQHSLHGVWLPGFHLANLAIHAGAAGLLFLLVRGAINRTAPGWSGRRATAVGFFSALLWSLHPLQTHSVTYLYQRFESLMGLFFLASVWCLLKGTATGARQTVWLIAGFTCFCLGVATKEVAVMTPLLLLLFDRAYLAHSWQDILQRRWAFYLASGAVVAAGLAYVLANYEHYLAGGLLCANRVSVWQYLRTQPEVVLHYLAQAVWPSHLSIDPAWPVQNDPGSLTLAWTIVVVGLTGTWWLWRQDRRLGFLPLWFGLILVPTSSVAPVIDLAFEHRVYLSLAAPAVAVIVAVVRWLPIKIALATCVIAAGSLGIATWQRNEVHASPLALWSDTAIKAPHNTRAWANVGSALLFAGRADEAMLAFRRIVQLFEAAVADRPDPVASAARRTPRTIEYVWYAYDRLGNYALDRGDLETARRCFAAITHLPDLPKGGLEHPAIRRLRSRLQQVSSSK